MFAPNALIVTIPEARLVYLVSLEAQFQELYKAYQEQERQLAEFRAKEPQERTLKLVKSDTPSPAGPEAAS